MEIVIHPSFNYPGETKGRFCGTHQASSMINVIVNRCQEQGCITVASFNQPGRKDPLFCSAHKKNGMQNEQNPIWYAESKGPYKGIGRDKQLHQWI